MKQPVRHDVCLHAGLLLAVLLFGASGCQPSGLSDSDHVTAVVDPVVSKQRAVAEQVGPSDGAETKRSDAAETKPSDQPEAKLDPYDPRARPRLGAGDMEPDNSARPRLPQRPIRPGQINDITFDDLELKMPLDSKFTDELLTDRVRQLDNQKVRIRGFIFAGGVFRQTGITSFPLVMNTQCKFGPGGFAYCVILVDLDEGVTTNFTTRPVTVEGTLTVDPFNSAGFTWSVYHIQGTKVM